MNRLIAELQRLYFLPGQQGRSRDVRGALTPEIVAGSLAGGATVALDPVGPDGMAKTLAIGFERARDWEKVAALYQGVQADFDLPAPAVSVSGSDGYQVWFSLAQPVPAEQARRFLAALCRKYLAEIPSARLRLHPQAASAEADPIELAPALRAETGKWSAFIDPAMGGMFVDEPGLEMAPNLDKQADLLAGFASIKAGDFQRTLNSLESPDEAAGSAPSAETAGHTPSTLKVGSGFSDPKSFLLAVMNDPSASAGQRIEAAKALLPYFEKNSAK